jgi:hypothetical protein
MVKIFENTTSFNSSVAYCSEGSPKEKRLCSCFSVQSCPLFVALKLLLATFQAA